MELLAPKISLTVMTLLLVSMVLLLTSLLHLVFDRRKVTLDKLFWCVVILFVPLVGPALYLLVGRTRALHY